MAETKLVAVSTLNLDLHNFRTVPQKNEVKSLHAMVAINPAEFWALTQSLLDDGYIELENILVLKGPNGKELTVKEGNRRIAALKLVLGQISGVGLTIPADIVSQLKNVSSEWKKANAEVPCRIYESNEYAKVDKLVSLIHGKAQKAGRTMWEAVATARHARIAKPLGEPALDLLEKYLKVGLNITADQRERWSGVYPLTVLDEAARKLATRVGLSSVRDVADAYPKTLSLRDSFEEVMLSIGLGNLSFPIMRAETPDFALEYGFPPLPKKEEDSSGKENPNTKTGTGGSGGSGGGGSSGTGKKGRGKKVALSTNDPRYVRYLLNKMQIVGQNRAKVVTLRDEAKSLLLRKHPHAFCFLIRCIFELSAKAYCEDHVGEPNCPKYKDSKTGIDRNLVDVIRDVQSHLTAGQTDKNMIKTLHGAMAEIARKDSFLSITSLNQLVHSKFAVTESHIATVFSNVYPLLEAMNS